MRILGSFGMTLKKNEAVAIVGSNSEVAKWIQEYYEQQNVVTIGLSRKSYSDYKYISLCDIKEMKGIFSRIKDLGVELTSLYYCPGFIGEKSLADLEWETWSEAINVNLNGAFCIYRALIDTLGTASSLKFIVTGYLPNDTKFTKGELRLNEDIPESSFVRHGCTLGDLIVYHPSIIHSEDSSDKEFTRVNLEYRYRPQ